MDITQSPRAIKAMAYFREGYNCAQSSFLAFNDLIDIPFEQATMIASSFGAGMGRLREVCGSLSGIFMVSGMLYGYNDIKDKSLKTAHYKRIQFLAKRFKEINNSDTIICRELLHLRIKGADKPEPQDRTEKYYVTRPCERLVGISCAIMEEYIAEHPYK